MKISSFCTDRECAGVEVRWKKSSLSFSNSNCVEVSAFGKSSLSTNQGACVEAGAFGKSSLSAANGDCVEAGAFGTSSLSNMNGSCVEVGAFRCASNECVEVGAVRKSSFSAGGNCVEAGAFGKSSLSFNGNSCVETGAVRRSSFSAENGNCVEAAEEEYVILVRDTKDRSIAPVVFSLDGWQKFVNRIKAGEFPLEDGVEEYIIGHLVFSRGEWDAFIKGCAHVEEDTGKGEFDLSDELEAELARA